MTTTTLNHSSRTLNIELLAIDLSTCSRCTGSLSNVEQAIAVIMATGRPHHVNKTSLFSIDLKIISLIPTY